MKIKLSIFDWKIYDRIKEISYTFNSEYKNEFYYVDCYIQNGDNQKVVEILQDCTIPFKLNLYGKEYYNKSRLLRILVSEFQFTIFKRIEKWYINKMLFQPN